MSWEHGCCMQWAAYHCKALTGQAWGVGKGPFSKLFPIQPIGVNRTSIGLRGYLGLAFIVIYCKKYHLYKLYCKLKRYTNCGIIFFKFL